MGRLRFELRTNRLKAECSTAELATRKAPDAADRSRRDRFAGAPWGSMERITRRVAAATGAFLMAVWPP